MHDLMPLIGNLTVHDLSIITTHNTASSKLTATFSDNCLGLTAEESRLAHDASILPKALNPEGRFAQKWAQVQTLDLVEQLDAGVRSIDFRMIWTAPADQLSSARHDWYVNHRVQSAEPAMWYLERLKAWMDQHPGEIVSRSILPTLNPRSPNPPEGANVNLASCRQYLSIHTHLCAPRLLCELHEAL